MTPVKQAELDLFEENVLIALFGVPTIPTQYQMALSMFGINPNTYIQKFESFVEPFMNEDGTVNGMLAKKMIHAHKPEIENILRIPEDNFRLIDFLQHNIKPIISLIGGRI